MLENTSVDVNLKDEFNCTSLIQDARGGHLECIKLLLLRGADINMTDEDGLTPFISAAIGGNIDCLNVLEKEGAEIHAKNIYGCNAITYACVNGQEKCLQFLLDLEVKISGFGPLVNACKGNHLGCVKILVRNLDSEQIMKQDKYGKSALQHAYELKHWDCFFEILMAL